MLTATQQQIADAFGRSDATAGELASWVGFWMVGPTCSRCGGCGTYSYTQRYGHKCFGCAGTGRKAPKSAAGWKAVAGALEDRSSDLARYFDLHARRSAVFKAISDKQELPEYAGAVAAYRTVPKVNKYRTFPRYMVALEAAVNAVETEMSALR